MPIYDYLYQCIRDDILSGKIKKDEKLPSKREFAKHNKVSVITIENAYSQLLTEGFIYSLPKRGYYASDILKNTEYLDKNQNVKVAHEQEFVTKYVDHEYFVDLKSNSASLDNFPFSVWSKLMREVLSVHETSLLKIVPFNGIAELRMALSDYLYRFRGIAVSPDQIIIGAGTEYLYSRLIQLLGSEDRLHFAVEDPGYKKISEIYKSNGLDYSYIPVDDNGMKIDELEKSNANIAHISASHLYPLGQIMPIKRRQELLRWAAKKEDRYIIEDDYDCEFRINGKPVPPIKSYDTCNKVIYINTFSKTLSPSIRISYMVLPEKLMEKYINTMSFYACTVSSFEQYTLKRFISEGYFERHISRMRNYYKNLHSDIIKAVRKSEFINRAIICEGNAGTHILLKLDTDKTDKELIEAAAGYDVNITFVSEYCSDTLLGCGNYNHILIVNYSAIVPERMEYAFNVIAKIL